MAEQTKGNEWINIDPLGMWGKDGRISVSFRNGYPRFTWFHRTEKGEKAKYFSAPMNQSMFMCLASLIRIVAKSKVDIKKYLVCSNKDFTTQEKLIQGVMVVAKRGDKVYLGMKNGGMDAKTMIAEFSLGEYGTVYTDESLVDTGSIEAALAYANFMDYALLSNVGSLPVNGSVSNTARNEIDRKKKEEADKVKEEKEEEKPVATETIDDDIGF